MKRLLAIPTLIIRLLVDLLHSGARVAFLSLAPGQPDDVIVRMRYRAMTPGGAALLGWCVSLAPGSTVVANDFDRQELVLHILDRGNVARTVADVRRNYEGPLLALFGTGAP